MKKGFIAVLTTACVALAMPHKAAAGEVSIGIDTLIGGTKRGSCHMVTFRGPKDAEKHYRKNQADRFEPVDEAVAAELGKSVSVNAEVVTYNQPYCARDSGVPQRIILTAKNSTEPLVTIPLDQRKVPLANMMGAEFTATEGSASIGKDVIEGLIGKDLDFHLIYETHKFKDKWKKDYAAKILR